MKKYLIRLADHLDKKGLYKEANYLDKIIKLSDQEFEVDFDQPYIVDGSKPMGVAENLYELSWGTVFDIMVTDTNNVTSLKVDLPSGKIVTYTKSLKEGMPLANTIKDLNAKYNLGLREPKPSKELIKDDNEVLRMFADAIERSKYMTEPEMEKEFNYFYKNYGHLDPKFLSMIKEYKRDMAIASAKEEKLREEQAYIKSDKFKADTARAINELYKAISIADKGDVESAKSRLEYIISYFPHHAEEISKAMAVLKQTPGLMALRSAVEGTPVFTAIETEEVTPVGPSIKPIPSIPEKYMP